MIHEPWDPVVASRSWSAKMSTSEDAAVSSAGTGEAMTKKASMASSDQRNMMIAVSKAGALARACCEEDAVGMVRLLDE